MPSFLSRAWAALVSPEPAYHLHGFLRPGCQVPSQQLTVCAQPCPLRVPFVPCPSVLRSILSQTLHVIFLQHQATQVPGRLGPWS